MRIAFDLDNTLIPTTIEFSCGSSMAPFPLNLFFKERLRGGAIELLKEISIKHQLWIYTISLRSPIYLKFWFGFLGIKVYHVVNQDKHDIAVKQNSKYAVYSKAPRLFNIDLMIDDSPGVEIECRRQNCHVLIINPTDDDWVHQVANKIKDLSNIMI